MRVFVSYSHKQGEWVLGALMPVLEASGVEVLIDGTRFRAGLEVVGQMDSTQDEAERQLICWSADHRDSAACTHELKRALAKDPGFTGNFQLVRLDDTPLPAGLPTDRLRHPLWMDLRDRHAAEGWRLLLDGTGGRLDVAPTRWLKAKDAVARAIAHGSCVNIVTFRKRVGSSAMLRQLAGEDVPGMVLVDLEHGSTETRRGFLQHVLEVLGAGHPPLPQRPAVLGEFQTRIERRAGGTILGIEHFDYVKSRWSKDNDLFGMLRNLIEKKKLLLVTASHDHLANLLPADNPGSSIEAVTIELR